MAWLRQAVAAGFRDKDKLAKNKDLDAVRDCADFRELLAGLERSGLDLFTRPQHLIADGTSVAPWHSGARVPSRTRPINRTFVTPTDGRAARFTESVSARQEAAEATADPPGPRCDR